MEPGSSSRGDGRSSAAEGDGGCGRSHRGGAVRVPNWAFATRTPSLFHRKCFIKSFSQKVLIKSFCKSQFWALLVAGVAAPEGRPLGPAPGKSRWNFERTHLRKLWEGCRKSRRCSRDTYPESYITKYTSIRGTPSQSNISPSILVYEDKKK